eukprot:6291244-Alexandrium_andersonii.AAC.1
MRALLSPWTFGAGREAPTTGGINSLHCATCTHHPVVVMLSAGACMHVLRTVTSFDTPGSPRLAAVSLLSCSCRCRQTDDCPAYFCGQ